jgi:hypothetical protein
MNELNRLKIEAEKKAKKEAAEKTRSEEEYKRLNKAYHRTLQRSKGEHKKSGEI